LHREIIKSKVTPNVNDYSQSLFENILASTKHVIGQESSVISLFETLRKVMLRSVITTFFGEGVLEQFPTLIHEFYEFQDELEESIAKSTILPDWIAAPLFLNPVHKKKVQLIKKLSPVVKSLRDSNQVIEQFCDILILDKTLFEFTNRVACSSKER
jgi:hypothetical protein